MGRRGGGGRRGGASARRASGDGTHRSSPPRSTRIPASPERAEAVSCTTASPVNAAAKNASAPDVPRTGARRRFAAPKCTARGPTDPTKRTTMATATTDASSPLSSTSSPLSSRSSPLSSTSSPLSSPASSNDGPRLGPVLTFLRRLAPRWLLFAVHLALSLVHAARDALTSRRRERGALAAAVDGAESYEAFRTAAEALDTYDGLRRWKEDPVSPLYDWRLIRHRLALLRERRATGDVDGAMFLLRSGLLRNLGGIGNKDLFHHTRVGTKNLIDEYIDEVASALEWISRGPAAPGLSELDRYMFFQNTRHAFGRTALLLSGGAAFGMYHLGVIKALHEASLLPRVISGSSVGALVAGMLAVTTDEDLPRCLTPGYINLDVFDKIADGSALRRRVKRVMNEGTLMDVGKLEDWARTNMGNVTFEEAYRRTGRIVSITVSSTQDLQLPRLLNYLTAPNVLLWSAAAASCAIPGVYAAVELMAKDSRGDTVPYHPSRIKWSDGSIQNDMPMARLAEQFNCNHTVSVQVNPHYQLATKILNTDAQSLSWPRRALRMAMQLAVDEVSLRMRQIVAFGLMPRFASVLQPIFAQKYTGDITITPEIKLEEFGKLFKNPSFDELRECIAKGECSTWPYIHMIRCHTKIEMTLDSAVARLKPRVKAYIVD